MNRIVAGVLLYLVCLVRVAIVTMFGTPADGTVTVAKARDWFKVSVTYRK